MQRFLKIARDRASAAAASGLVTVSAALPGTPHVEGLHVTRVLAGPLRGKLLALPTLQRPSYALGTFEPHVVRAMQASVQPGSVAYDLGANVGYHTLVLAGLVGAAGTVVAVEPAATDRAALEATLRLNGQTNVRVVSSALAEQSGMVEFTTFGYSGISRIAREHEPADATIQTVPVTTLDHLVFEDGYAAPSFIKMDVEGAELRVLLGAMQLLAAYHPTIVCEVRWQATYEPICTLLTAHGYTPHVLWHGEAIGDILFTPNTAPPRGGSATICDPYITSMNDSVVQERPSRQHRQPSCPGFLPGGARLATCVSGEASANLDRVYGRLPTIRLRRSDAPPLDTPDRRRRQRSHAPPDSSSSACSAPSRTVAPSPS
jgi:FkbM family methyltransferase